MACLSTSTAIVSIIILEIAPSIHLLPDLILDICLELVQAVAQLLLGFGVTLSAVNAYATPCLSFVAKLGNPLADPLEHW